MMNKLRDNKGAVLALVGVSTVALIGMSALAVDIGRLYAGKSRAQDICDASALAGAAHLDGISAAQPEAENVAQSAATANMEARTHWDVYPSVGGTDPGVDTHVPSGDETWTVNGRSVEVHQGRAIRVDGWVEVEFGLARIFNILGGDHNKGRARATSVAAMSPPQSIEGQGPPSPIVAQAGTLGGFGENQEYELKSDSWKDDLGPGNFGLADLGQGSGQKNMRDSLAGTYDFDPIAIGDTVGTVTGNRDISDIQKRWSDGKSNYADGEYAQWVSDGYPIDGRVIIIVVVDEVTRTNGSKDIVVVGFAAFYVDSYSETEDGKRMVSGVYVEAVYYDEAIGEQESWKFIKGSGPVPEEGSVLGGYQLVL